ncbi:MAG: NAD(P)/FAD-dependent oxidoreductase [Rhodothalassiaceae bacterium]
MVAETDGLDIAVIGAGIIGVSIALRLAAEGHRVLLLDRAGAGEGCSKGNAGHIAVEHIIPLARPATVAAMPRMLLDNNGPLRIDWRYLPQLLPWLARFLWAARPVSMRRGMAALAALHAGVMPAFDRLDREHDLSAFLRRAGNLVVAGTARGFRAARAEAATLRRWGFASEILSGPALRSFDPVLSQELAGGVFYPGSAHVTDPHGLVRHLFEACLARGATYRQRTVAAIGAGSDGFVLHCAEAAPVRTRRLVIAAGAWSARLLRPLGYRLPLDTERGYHLMLGAPTVTPRVPTTIQEQRFVLTPMRHGLRLAGRVEFAGLERPMDRRQAERLLPLAQQVCPALAAGSAEAWMGFRPTFPDFLPVIGRAPRHDGLYFAFGHQHLGLTQSAVTAEITADLVAGRTPAIDIAPFSAARFA